MHSIPARINNFGIAVMDFTEKQMVEVIISHAQELLGEPLSLLERNWWIGRSDAGRTISHEEMLSRIRSWQR